MTLTESIEAFVDFFGTQASLVSSLQGDPTILGGASDPQVRVAIHKKVLYCAILDSLARVRYYGQSLGNRDRFVGFIRDHGGWSDGELISVPILTGRLSSKTPSVLQQHLVKRLAAHDPNAGNGLPLTVVDEPRGPLEQLAADETERKSILQTQHYELFYKYRNFLVHEFREPGYGSELFAEITPVYHAHLNDPTWRLVYPEGFFKKLVDTALHSLKSYFVCNGIDPFTRITDSSKWSL